MSERAVAGTRTEMVMASIRQRIAGRSLAPGAKLPSIRKLASTLSVAPSTVVEAYERLAAEGVVLPRPVGEVVVAGQDERGVPDDRRGLAGELQRRDPAVELRSSRRPRLPSAVGRCC